MPLRMGTKKCDQIPCTPRICEARESGVFKRERSKVLHQVSVNGFVRKGSPDRKKSNRGSEFDTLVVNGTA